MERITRDATYIGYRPTKQHHEEDNDAVNEKDPDSIVLGAKETDPKLEGLTNQVREYFYGILKISLANNYRFCKNQAEKLFSKESIDDVARNMEYSFFSRSKLASEYKYLVSRQIITIQKCSTEKKLSDAFKIISQEKSDSFKTFRQIAMEEYCQLPYKISKSENHYNFDEEVEVTKCKPKIISNVLLSSAKFNLEKIKYCKSSYADKKSRNCKIPNQPSNNSRLSNEKSKMKTDFRITSQLESAMEHNKMTTLNRSECDEMRKHHTSVTQSVDDKHDSSILEKEIFHKSSSIKDTEKNDLSGQDPNELEIVHKKQHDSNDENSNNIIITTNVERHNELSRLDDSEYESCVEEQVSDNDCNTNFEIVETRLSVTAEFEMLTYEALTLNEENQTDQRNDRENMKLYVEDDDNRSEDSEYHTCMDTYIISNQSSVDEHPNPVKKLDQCCMKEFDGSLDHVTSSISPKENLSNQSETLLNKRKQYSYSAKPDHGSDNCSEESIYNDAADISLTSEVRQDSAEKYLNLVRNSNKCSTKESNENLNQTINHSLEKNSSSKGKCVENRSEQFSYTSKLDHESGNCNKESICYDAADTHLTSEVGQDGAENYLNLVQNTDQGSTKGSNKNLNQTINHSIIDLTINHPLERNFSNEKKYVEERSKQYSYSNKSEDFVKIECYMPSSNLLISTGSPMPLMEKNKMIQNNRIDCAKRRLTLVFESNRNSNLEDDFNKESSYRTSYSAQLSEEDGDLNRKNTTKLRNHQRRTLNTDTNLNYPKPILQFNKKISRQSSNYYSCTDDENILLDKNVPEKESSFVRSHSSVHKKCFSKVQTQSDSICNERLVSDIKRVKLSDKDVKKLKSPCLTEGEYERIQEETFKTLKSIIKAYYFTLFIPNKIAYKNIFRNIHCDILSKHIYDEKSIRKYAVDAIKSRKYLITE